LQLSTPPPPSLFPYTTLFRSSEIQMGSAAVVPMIVERNLFGILIAARVKADGFSIGECEFLRTLCAHVALAAYQARLHTQLQSADRKSTRLNSSHQIISYAVF